MIRILLFLAALLAAYAIPVAVGTAEGHTLKKQRCAYLKKYPKWRRCYKRGKRHNRWHRCNRHAPVKRAIRCAFPRAWRQARRVAWCESSYRTWARNGQYRGLFQMGARERRRYGHASHALGQAKAARRYFDATGRTWGPWECKP